jgi:hypothetical protein
VLRSSQNGAWRRPDNRVVGATHWILSQFLKLALLLAQASFSTMHCVVGSSTSASGLSNKNFSNAARTPDRIE